MLAVITRFENCFFSKLHVHWLQNALINSQFHYFDVNLIANLNFVCNFNMPHSTTRLGIFLTRLCRTNWKSVILFLAPTTHTLALFHSCNACVCVIEGGRKKRAGISRTLSLSLSHFCHDRRCFDTSPSLYNGSYARTSCVNECVRERVCSIIASTHTETQTHNSPHTFLHYLGLPFFLSFFLSLSVSFYLNSHICTEKAWVKHTHTHTHTHHITHAHTHTSHHTPTRTPFWVGASCHEGDGG